MGLSPVSTRIPSLPYSLSSPQLTDGELTGEFPGEDSENKKPPMEEEYMAWIYNDFFVWLIHPPFPQQSRN